MVAVAGVWTAWGTVAAASKTVRAGSRDQAAAQKSRGSATVTGDVIADLGGSGSALPMRAQAGVPDPCHALYCALALSADSI